MVATSVLLSVLYFSDLRQSTFWVGINDTHDNETLYWLNGEQADWPKGKGIDFFDEM